MHRPSLFSQVFYRTSPVLSTIFFDFSPHNFICSGHTDAVPVEKEVPHMEERKNAKSQQNTNEQNTQNTQNTNKNARNTKNAKNCK